MPDLTAVLQTMAQNLQTPIYPNGVDQPSVVGVPVTINDGWPIRTQLDQILQAGSAMVSVYPTKAQRAVTKFERVYQPLTLTPATLTLTVAGLTITVGGTISVPQAAVLIVNDVPYSYVVQITDTLNSVAAALAALVPGATVSGAVITLVSAYRLKALVSSNYSAAEEIARIDQVFQISCWCPNPQMRATLEAAIDVYEKLNYRIPLSDGFTGQVFFLKMDIDDMLEKSLMYVSHLFYTVQYPTTVTNNFNSLADNILNLTLKRG
jgi:hypothetical protein